METPPRRLAHRLALLGAEVDVVTPSGVIETTAQAIGRRERTIVANHNLHSLYLYRRSASMKAFYAKASVIEIDSMPMIAWARLMGHAVSRENRCTYLDFREDLWRRAARDGWRVFHVGGAPEVAEPARQAITDRHPGVALEVRHGYFDVNGPENDRLIADIASFKPDVLLVGMGMPRQEMWILNNFERLPACVIFNVGAAFDYEAGAQVTAPRWSGQIGLEWLFRFFADPKRLFARYFLEPWALIPAAIADLKRRGTRVTA